MCGLFGVAPFNTVHLEEARHSLNLLRHRGPDQYGEWYDRHAYLGHRRLSILDLSDAGRQPMKNRDESIILTINGEIYNYKQIRNDLAKRYEFQSRSDSEVILHGYAEWGIDGILNRIDGMFAFSIYDRRKNALYLVRDRVGIKPLYYYLKDGQLMWSSELKAIHHYAGYDKLIIDQSAMCDFYTYNYIPTPKTIYKDVFKLKPAHYLAVDLNTISCTEHEYWRLPTEEIPISFDEAKENLKYLITKSVNEQMMSDVPVGFFLSGGLDSSTVVAYASQLSNQLNAYTIGFNDPGSDETDFAVTVARTFNVLLQHKKLQYADAEKLLTKVISFYDEPFGDLSAIPTYCVSAFAREYATVALTGDGGDEIFGGYRWYRFADSRPASSSDTLKRFLSFFRSRFRYSLPGKLVNRIQFHYSLNLFEKMVRCQEAFIDIEKDDVKYELGLPKDYEDYWYYRDNYDLAIPPRKAIQKLDFNTYLPDDILTKVDRASMAVSLEARVPLLSKEIIEFAFSLPENILYHNGELKGLLKAILTDILPDSIVYRQKKGFSIPLQKWSKYGLFDKKTFQEFIAGDFFKRNSKAIGSSLPPVKTGVPIS
ncbi:asparagine synthase (glutamine-hydrolyzing) [bacterium]|nr:asparagine synthase (glutamine-hydrolyzing) [bacterium]